MQCMSLWAGLSSTEAVSLGTFIIINPRNFYKSCPLHPSDSHHPSLLLPHFHFTTSTTSLRNVQTIHPPNPPFTHPPSLSRPRPSPFHPLHLGPILPPKPLHRFLRLPTSRSNLSCGTQQSKLSLCSL